MHHSLFSANIHYVTTAEGQLKLFIAQDNPSGEIFIQPLRGIQQILERSMIKPKKFAHSCIYMYILVSYVKGSGHETTIYTLDLVRKGVWA